MLKRFLEPVLLEGVTATSSGPTTTDHSEPPLSAPLTLSFDYTRSVGTTLSKFFTALREHRVLGVRGSDGRVHVPPAEYDPVTYQPLGEMVPVSSVGTVVSWTWQPDPLEGQPLDRPFAWALIKLDGADTPLLHAVDAGESDKIKTGARVHAHWADETVGAITDIAYFALGSEEEPVADPTSGDQDPVTMIVTPVSLTIQHTASHEESAYLRAIAEGKLLGAKTGKSGKVYFPPHGADPATGQPTTEFVELPDKGTVTTFAIINIPFQGQRIKPPYVAAYVLLDGADIPFLHLVADTDANEVRMGMRVEAIWRPREEWGFGIDNIEYFRPTGEPDAEYDTYKHHL
ncbi:DNA-binding protein [Mycobacterium montefiorense]|nr:DNA-binding protein [Mycobacterium montefiorense]